jgi:hypothetical protein
MATSWNYERRQLTCGKLVIGVWLVAKGKPGFATSIEAVRNRMRLPPEDALFAARRLDEEGLIAFDPGGTVTSNAKGIAHAAGLVDGACSKARQLEDARLCLTAGGLPLAMLEVAVMARGGSIECEAPPWDAGGAYRLALAGEGLGLQRRTPGADWEPAPASPT